jgi:hypothetical protein
MTGPGRHAGQQGDVGPWGNDLTYKCVKCGKEDPAYQIIRGRNWCGECVEKHVLALEARVKELESR